MLDSETDINPLPVSRPLVSIIRIALPLAVMVVEFVPPSGLVTFMVVVEVTLIVQVSAFAMPK
jgi:hypothetical protein